MMMNGWGFTGRAGMPMRFEEQYHCYSVAYADKAHLEGGDKILLPPSAFDTLARLNVDYPMLFQLQSPSRGTMTHCGVLEFTAEEGSCYIPFWMMQNLLIEEGTVLTVTNVSLPKATFVKLQPQHVDFLEITNPRAVLEHALRNYSCVTKGDVICLPYNNKNYHFELKEVKPQDAACIIETDCNVDFDAPVGYKEPERPGRDPSPAPSSTPGSSFHGPPSQNDDRTDDAATKPPGIRIVDGLVVRPDEATRPSGPSSDMLAEKTGATGVQPNAAVPIRAPQVDYWAVNAGDGARLDGKTPVALKDKDGTEIDVRKLRAEAAARRAEAAAKNAAVFPVKKEEEVPAPAAVSKRKTRIGSKFSKRKGGGGFAFEGQGHKM